MASTFVADFNNNYHWHNIKLWNNHNNEKHKKNCKHNEGNL